MENNRNNNDIKSAQVNSALMHAAINLLQDPPNLEEQYSTGCDAGYTPVVETTDNAPAANNNNNNSNAEDALTTVNSTRRTPTVATCSWHYTAMSAATFTLSALLGYIATEAIFKRIRGRNN